MDIQRDRRLDQGNYDTVVFLDDRRRSRNSALYVQDEWRLGWGIINAGLRHDRYSTFGTATSPRAALILPVKDGTTVKLLGGKAFRVPNAYELYYSDGNITQMANPNLRPETIRTREVVLEQRLAQGWRASVSAYDYSISDLIRQVNDPGTGLLVFQNLAQVNASGVEFEAGGRLWGRLDTQASLALQRSRDIQTGTTPVNSPNRIGKLRLGLPFMDERAQAGMVMRYLSPRPTQAGNQIGTSVLIDLTLRARLGSSGTTFALSAYNLFNRPYADPGAREHTQDVIPQAGRTVWLTLEQRL
jgi:iron complex outermembrane receptor protein